MKRQGATGTTHVPLMNLNDLSYQELEALRDQFLHKLCRVERALRRREKEGVAEETEAPPDFSIFKPTTCRLLTAMYEAPDKMLYHDDIRQDVMDDEYASEMAIKNVVRRARQEIGGYEIEIKNIHGKGYQLITEK